jgi:hypothetical protein
MFSIIGSDGKTYGPVSAEQIRAWIAQGRVDNRTTVFVAGASEWTYIGICPEFAKDFSVPPPVAAPIAPAFKLVPKTNSFATAGFIFGLLSWGCCGCCPFSVFGLTFSLIALAQISASSETQSGRALAIVGLICSATSLLLGLGFGFLQMVMQPGNVAWHVGRF